MDTFSDSARDRHLRKQLVQLLKSKGITDPAVLHAMYAVPRHIFVPHGFRYLAYEDRPIPIGEGQTISQPYTVAYQSQLLEVKIGDRILEVGTGSMYQACILSAMGGLVYTIERQKKLFDRCRHLDYAKECPGIRMFFGDGYEGLAEYAPFDKILVTAAAPVIPSRLVQQLKPGGMLVLPLGQGDTQTMLRLTKLSEGKARVQYFNDFSFVPMLKGTRDD